MFVSEYTGNVVRRIDLWGNVVSWARCATRLKCFLAECVIFIALQYTIAGTVNLGSCPSSYANGAEGVAILCQPVGLAVSTTGEVYVAEAGGYRIRWVA
jgi:hypothetical protein